MQVWPTKSVEFRWRDSRSRQVEASASANVPIAAAAGITVQAGIGTAFQKSVQNFVEFTSLTASLSIPSSRISISASRKIPPASYIKEHKHFKTWSLFMVTGIMIARGGKTGTAKRFVEKAMGALECKPAFGREVEQEVHDGTDFMLQSHSIHC